MYDYDVIPFSDIVQKLSIKRAKNGNYHCPDVRKHENGDNNASMSINEVDGVFFCHACGAKGRRIDLIQLALNCNYKDAENWLKENFPQNKAKIKEPAKKHCRLISANTDESKGKRFLYLQNPSLRSANENDIEQIKQIMGKRFNLQGFANSKMQICDNPYSLVPFNTNKMYYTPENPKGILIVEGITDFLALCSSALSIDFAIFSRRAKTDGYTIPLMDVPIYFFIDPDDTEIIALDKCKNKRIELSRQTIYFVSLHNELNVKDVCKFFSIGYESNQLLKIMNESQQFDILDYFENVKELPFKFWDKSLNLNVLEFWRVLQKKGFQYVTIESEYKRTTQLMRIYNNIAEPYEVNDVLNFAYNELLDELPEKFDGNITPDLIREKVLNSSNILNLNKFCFLKRNDVEFNRDTKDTAFFYFLNGYIEVTKESITFNDYANLPKPIYKTQIKKWNINFIDSEFFYDLNYYVFLQNVCKPTRESDVDESRFNALKSVIGYLCHKFNNPANQKCIILSESNTSGTPKGGTGKGLIMKAIKNLINVHIEDGKRFNVFDKFVLQSIQSYDDLIYLDDIMKNFPFEMIFSMITEGIQFEQKGKSPIRIPAELAPKFALSTNYAINSENTSSYKRRIYEMELYTYYDEKFTPEFEFNEWFFFWNDDAEKWNLFYSMMFTFVQYFLKNGLQNYESETIKERVAANVGGKDLLEFMDDWIGKLIDFIQTDIKSLYTRYLEFALTDTKNYSAKKFNSAVKAYCAARGYVFSPCQVKNIEGKECRGYRIMTPEYAENHNQIIDKSITKSEIKMEFKNV